MTKAHIKRSSTINTILIGFGIVLFGVGVWLQQSYAHSSIYAFWASVIAIMAGVILITTGAIRD